MGPPGAPFRLEPGAKCPSCPPPVGGPVVSYCGRFIFDVTQCLSKATVELHGYLQVNIRTYYTFHFLHALYDFLCVQSHDL